MCRSLLVYDGSNRAFRRLARLVTSRMDDVRPVRWSSAPAQAFLDAQFGGHPFVFLVVEGDTVHVGDAALEWVLDHTRLPPGVTRQLARHYPRVAGPFGRVVHGRAPADIHGTFPLAKTARRALEPLRGSCSPPTQRP